MTNHPASSANSPTMPGSIFVQANSLVNAWPSPSRSVVLPGASALGSFSSLNTFLDVPAVGGVVAGCLSDGAVLAHQKGHSKTINLFLFLSRFNS